MIHYHGTPITPVTAAQKALRNRHAMISYANPEQLQTVAEIASSIVFDNGAFPQWKNGKVVPWDGYYKWVDTHRRLPNFDWAVIPDVIDGDEDANDRLLEEWPFGAVGIPVWHMHESLARLERLVLGWPRIALGSSGTYKTPGSSIWWSRMEEALAVICDSEGWPRAKIHGLRMLSPKIYTRIPFASADSTNIARNIGLDKRWTGSYQPRSKEGRAVLLADNIEADTAPLQWVSSSLPFQTGTIPPH